MNGGTSSAVFLTLIAPSVQRLSRANRGGYRGRIGGDIGGESPSESTNQPNQHNQHNKHNQPDARAREEQPAAAVVKALNNGGMLTPSAIIVDKLMAFVENDGMEVEAVILAIETAAMRGLCRADYIAGILRRWRDAGIRTRVQAEAHEVQARASPPPEKRMTAEEIRALKRRMREESEFDYTANPP